jgi:membrane protease YdiL (CAAX protease family)
MQQPFCADDDAAVRWGAAEIGIIILLTLPSIGLWPALVFEALDRVGLFRRLYGADAVALVRADDEHRQRQRQALEVIAGPGAVEDWLPRVRRLMTIRLNLWATVLAFPFQAATIPFVLYAASRTRPAQLGLTTRRLGRNLLLGFAVFLVLAPLVLGINALVEILYRRILGGEPQAHPLTLVATAGLTPAEWVLLVLSGVVTAPVLEEMIFRGLLQRYFARQWWGGHAAAVLAFAVALSSCWARVRAAAPPAAALNEAGPALFILALVPAYLLVAQRSRTPAGPAIFGTSALFAAIHSSVWPSPVALFVLALGLAILAHRTRSLAGPMLLHGLFNGIACVRLVLGW